ncbi:hypothetical protein A3848_14805 [Paenibacillus sp. P32E]|nr:hypothetical protein A3848_14805 [Paenibacillus sp. P32E]
MIITVGYLDVLPVSSVLAWFGGLMLVIYILEFVWMPANGRLRVNGVRGFVKKITADVLIFLILTSVLVYSLHPQKSPVLLLLVFALSIVSYLCSTGFLKLSFSFRVWGTAVHILLCTGFYWLFGMMLMDSLKVTFNLNMTDNFDILYFVHGQERGVVYGFLAVLAILYFVIGKLYMRPVYALYSEAYEARRQAKVEI